MGGQIAAFDKSGNAIGGGDRARARPPVIGFAVRLAAGLGLHGRHAKHFKFARGHDEDVAGIVDLRHPDRPAEARRCRRLVGSGQPAR